MEWRQHTWNRGRTHGIDLRQNTWNRSEAEHMGRRQILGNSYMYILTCGLKTSVGFQVASTSPVRRSIVLILPLLFPTAIQLSEHTTAFK